MPPFVARKRHRSSSPQPDFKPPPAKRPTRTPQSNKKKPTLFEAVDAKPTSSRSVEDNKKFLAQLDVDNDEDEDEDEDVDNDEDNDEKLSDVSSDEFEDVVPKPRAKRRKLDDADNVARHHSSIPLPHVKPSPARRPARTPQSNKKKPTLFEAVDAKPTSSRSVEDNKNFLAQLDIHDGGDEDLSDISSDEFEDVMPTPGAKRRKLDDSDEGDDDDDEMAWEDAIAETKNSSTLQPLISGNLELTLDSVPTHTMASVTDADGKKGPSKIERGIRNNTHCLHVQCLLLHNFIRNNWACDKSVQQALLRTLSPGIKKEIDKWRSACGDLGMDQDVEKVPTNGSEGRRKGKEKAAKSAKKDKVQRDWGKNADHIKSDTPNLSRGDPTVRLLKFLSAYWKKRFSVSAPGLRKHGYKDLVRLDEEVKAHRKNPKNADLHGERIEGRAGFRKLAEKCTGSRDVGAQLFTAFLRGIGLEARLVASLQPIGFGWSKSEEAHPSKKHSTSVMSESEGDSSEVEEEEGEEKEVTPPQKQVTKDDHKPVRPKARPKSKSKSKQPQKSSGGKDAPIDLSDDESELSSAPSTDDESVIDVTPSVPTKLSKRYDRDLSFPVYWTEVLSPITQIWIPVDPIVLSVVGQTPEHLVLFEPRGAKADRAKHVHAYVVAYSADGTAKDVTVRYLKRHQWPGKTKGVRFPSEKMPIYNKRGKVIRYEEYDWFARVMRLYARPSLKQTEADRIEDANELQPVRVVREPKAGGEETLQGYKNSAEFVLERHLRREEALLPHAKPVKTFTTGKGDKLKSEPVYRRIDVVPCRTMESWHKEGRAVKEGEQPLKHVPMRAVTLIRKREIEEAERETGEKMKQGLYSRAQTDWIIPPPIHDGVIPKNAFGNMDVYVPTMVPRGAVHIRLKGTARICKKLGIDFAEACTGFEFGNKRAVPVLTGVVVAKENEGTVRDAWRADDAEKKKKEAAKREKIALGMWKKMLAGLRIVERVRREYGGDAESHIQDAIHPMAAKKGKGKAPTKDTGKSTKGKNNPNSGNHLENPHHIDSDSDTGEAAGAGGFLLDSDDDDEQPKPPHPDNNNNKDNDQLPGGFILEARDSPTHRLSTKPSKPADLGPSSLYPRTPVSLQSLHQQSRADTPNASASAHDSIGEDGRNGRMRSDGEDEEQPTPPAPKRTTSTRGRGRTRARIAKPSSTSRASNSETTTAHTTTNALTTPSSDNDEPAPSSPSASESAPPKRGNSRGGRGRGRGRGRGEVAAEGTRRNAGRKSKEGVRSRYFDGEGSGGEVDG